MEQNNHQVEKVWSEEYNDHIPYVSEEELGDMLRKEFPEGFTVSVRDESVENLLEYQNLKTMDYGDFNWTGYIGENISMLKVYGDLPAELRLKPEDYGLVYADEDTYWDNDLSDADWDTGANATSCLVYEARRNKGGSLREARVSIPETERLLDRLFILGRSYYEVVDFIKKHDITRDSQLLRAYALQDLMRYGFKQGQDVPECLKKDMLEVERLMQQMYGGRIPFREHSYYEGDVRPDFEQRCREQAEIVLKKEGYIPCEKHNLVVDYVQRDNLYAAREMMSALRRQFPPTDCTVQLDGNRLTVAVHTLSPEKQLDIRNTLVRSWAQKGWWQKEYRPELAIKDEAHYIITSDGQAVRGYINPQKMTTDYKYALQRGDIASNDWHFIAKGDTSHAATLYTEQPLDMEPGKTVTGIEKLVPEADLDMALHPDHKFGYVAPGSKGFDRSAGVYKLRMNVVGGGGDAWYMSKPMYEADSRIFDKAVKAAAEKGLAGRSNLDWVARIYAADYYKEELRQEQAQLRGETQSAGMKR